MLLIGARVPAIYSSKTRKSDIYLLRAKVIKRLFSCSASCVLQKILEFKWENQMRNSYEKKFRRDPPHSKPTASPIRPVLSQGFRCKIFVQDLDHFEREEILHGILHKTPPKFAIFFLGFVQDSVQDFVQDSFPPPHSPKHSTMHGLPGAEGILSRILVRTRLTVAWIEAKIMTH